MGEPTKAQIKKRPRRARRDHRGTAGGAHIEGTKVMAIPLARTALAALALLSAALWFGAQIGAAAYEARHINIEETP